MLKMRQLKELAVIVPVVLLTGYSCPCQADQLRFERARDWTEWTLPARAVEIMADGTIQPVRVSRPINAALNAQRFVAVCAPLAPTLSTERLCWMEI